MTNLLSGKVEMKFKPNRRMFLKGLGGYMLSLPILEVMLNNNGDAYASGASLEGNYIYTFHGESSGHPRNATCLFKPPQYGNLQSVFNASATEYGSAGLKKLHQMGLLADINLISNLYINSNNPGSPGNIQVKDNSASAAPIMHRSSTLCVNSGHGCPKDVNTYAHYRTPKGKHSTDQHLYDAIGKAGKHINFAVEKYQDGWHQSSSMRDGYIQTPEKDIGKAFDYLFGGFVAPENGGATDAKTASRRSILNLVLEDHKRLQNKLGYADRIIVDQHLSSIRDLEKSIADMQAQDVANACTVPGRLSENTPINSRNYGGEKERALLFNQMIALAVSCGITRVAQYCILRHKAYVNPYDYITNSTLRSKILNDTKLQDLHEIGHYGTLDSLNTWIEVLQWVTGIYGDLLQRLKSVPVGDGTLLDYSFLMMGMHQGIGLSLEGSSRNHVHSYENMSYLQAGGKAFGAVTGRHLNGNRKHPVAVGNKAAELMGVNITFGEIKDKVNIS